MLQLFLFLQVSCVMVIDLRLLASAMNVRVGAQLEVVASIGFIVKGAVRPRYYMIWLIHIIICCRYSGMPCSSLLDSGVCGMAFISVELLTEGTLDIIWVERSKNKVIGNPWGLVVSEIWISFPVSVGRLLSLLAIWISMDFIWKLRW